MVEKVTRDRDYAVTVQDVQEFEDKYGRLHQNDIVLIKTGFSRYYHLGAKEYLGFDEHVDGAYDPNTSKLSFPGISKAAAEYLVTHSPTHSSTHSLTYSLTHLLTHSLT